MQSSKFYTYIRKLHLYFHQGKLHESLPKRLLHVTVYVVMFKTCVTMFRSYIVTVTRKNGTKTKNYCVWSC